MKKFFAEFKEFITRGNVIDMAVAVIVGNAFKAIVTALVDNVIMPLISLAVGGLNFTEWKWVLTPAVGDTPEVAVNYGMFIQAIIDFLIVAFCIFVALKVVLAMQAKAKALFEKKQEEQAEEEAAAAETQEDILRDIRALLQEKKGE